MWQTLLKESIWNKITLFYLLNSHWMDAIALFWSFPNRRTPILTSTHIDVVVSCIPSWFVHYHYAKENKHDTRWDYNASCKLTVLFVCKTIHLVAVVADIFLLSCSKPNAQERQWWHFIEMNQPSAPAGYYCSCLLQILNAHIHCDTMINGRGCLLDLLFDSDNIRCCCN